MDILINDDYLFTLVFTDDQIVVALDEQDSIQLYDQKTPWRILILVPWHKFWKTEQLVIGGEEANICLLYTSRCV